MLHTALDIKTKTPLSDPLSRTLVPFYGVTGFYRASMLLNDEMYNFDYIRYAAKSYSNVPNTKDNGIAIAIEGIGIVIDQIAIDGAEEELDRLFQALCTIKTIDELHTYIFNYGNEARYRGHLD